MAKSKERSREMEGEKTSKKRRRAKKEQSPSPERRSKKKSSRRDSKRSKTKKGKGKERRRDGAEGSSGKHVIQAEIQISEKDYFTRAAEFKVWLYHKKKNFFEDLTSIESHELFDKFVKDWNRGKLDPHFYEGRLPDELVAKTKKTQHKWGFLNKLSDRDQMQLELANDSVHASTEQVKGVASNVPVLPVGAMASAPGVTGKQRGSAGGNGDDGGSGRKTELKRQRRMEREQHAVVLDEIAPKETGRQAITDKRRAVGAGTHAAAKEREDAADGLEMKESDTMGGSESFHETLARAQHGKQRRQAAKMEHLQGLAAKEEEIRAAFIANMGLQRGKKITIQPRREG